MQTLFDDVGVREEEIEEGAGEDRGEGTGGVQQIPDPAPAGEPAQLQDHTRPTGRPAFRQTCTTQCEPISSGNSSLKRSTRLGPYLFRKETNPISRSCGCPAGKAS